MSHRNTFLTAGLGTLAVLLLFGGCESGRANGHRATRVTQAAQPAKPRGSLDTDAMTKQAAADLKHVLATPKRETTARGQEIVAAARGDGAESNPTPNPTPDEAAAGATPPPTPTANPTDPSEPTPDSRPPTPLEESKIGAMSAPQPDQEFADLASHLARALRDAQCEAGASGMPGAKKAPPEPLALAALEALRPGALNELDVKNSPLTKLLSIQDLATLRDARDRLMADPEARARLAEAAGRSLDALSPPAAITIRKSALCSRVNGFGSFTAFPTSAFLIGRPLRAIVYLELDGFGSRAAHEGDPGFMSGLSLGGEAQRAVEITQTIGLYQDQSGLLAWRSPARTSIEVTKSARRDFYLVQMIDLPRALSIGRYRLKVTVTDKATGATAETSLPIDIVADQTLTVR